MLCSFENNKIVSFKKTLSVPTDKIIGKIENKHFDIGYKFNKENIRWQCGTDILIENKWLICLLFTCHILFSLSKEQFKSF